MLKDRLYAKKLSLRNQYGVFLKKSHALHKLYQRQQPKVAASPRKAALLKTFAEEDYQRIAKLIQKWLEKDSTK